MHASPAAQARPSCVPRALLPRPQVRVFGSNPEGVVSVKFKAEGPADECTRLMNGRFFGGRRLEAFKWDGVTNYNVKVGGGKKFNK